MKDYYKILEVEEEASGEEIRARWMELIKHYHPDLRKTEGEDERIEEINEAYDILKNESTRFDYDLERNLMRSIIKKTRRPKGRGMNIRKIMLPAGMVVLLLIVGLMSYTWLNVTEPPTSQVPKEMAKGLEKKTAPQIPPVKTESGANAQKTAPGETKKEVALQESEEIVSMSPQAFPSGAERKLEKKEESPQKILPKAEAPVKVEEVVQAKEEPKPVKEPDPQGVVKSEAPVRVEKEVPKEVPREVPKEPTGAILHPGKKLAINIPPPLAKEEEVKQFFSSYIDLYHQKDIDGFLSLFSSKVVQNQKDGLKEIRSIYTKFFDQSKELQYRLEGMETEIYQNAVEVKARFRVDQILKRGGEEKAWIGTIAWVLVKEDGVLKIISLNYQNQKSP
jgi:curved DNA-binding protein CbpA